MSHIDERTGRPKIILDLCGGTGAWGKPYKDAGYDVRLITLPEYDVLTYKPPENVYGILAAPPCTDLALSGAQHWKAKDADGRTLASIIVVLACLRIISYCQSTFWCLENPVGRLRHWLGSPQLIFNPCDYGDPYTKKTLLWGRFLAPEKTPVKPEYVIAKNGDRYSPVHWHTGGKSARTKEMRSITPCCKAALSRPLTGISCWR